jgi:hypothetical protein
MENKICPLPWNQLMIQQNGDFRLCCQCVHPPFGKPGMSIQKHSIEEARNSELHQRVRMQMLAGEQPAECQLCWDEESHGLNSKRLHMLTHYSIDKIKQTTSGYIDVDEFPLAYLDLRFGNLCNMKCRSCGPGDSSLWYEDVEAVNPLDYVAFDFYLSKQYKLKKINNTWTLKDDDFTWYESDSFWNMMRNIIPNVDRLYLTGGEPLINKAQWRLLDLCIELGVSNKIALEYNSNMTRIPDTAFSVWNQFKEVHIGCSIDAVDDLAYYIRYPGKWEDIKLNIIKLGNYTGTNLLAKFAPTISVFNVLAFLDLVDWLHDNYIPHIRPTPSFHTLEGPGYQNIQALPKETKDWIVTKYEEWYAGAPWRMRYKAQFDNILNYMQAQDRSHLLKDLREHTEKLDKHRNQNIADYVPWLAKILEKVG